MKTTTWLCPVLILLCATKLICTAETGSYGGGYGLDNMDSQMSQNDYLLAKRNKPSLSIVNPLDVLRQRLLLEIARRQMKENSRQVELNRAILKNVGKRRSSKYQSPLTAALYDIHELQQRQQQENVQHLQPYEYELIPAALIFDYLQQQQPEHQPYESTAIRFDNNYVNDGIYENALASSNGGSGGDVEAAAANAEQDIFAFNGVVGNDDKHSIKHMKQSNNEFSSTSPNQPRYIKSVQKSTNNRNDATKGYTLINNNHQLQHRKNDLNLELNDSNPVSAKTNANANTNAIDYKNEFADNGGDYQLERYLYHLHKNQNHLTRK